MVKSMSASASPKSGRLTLNDELLSILEEVLDLAGTMGAAAFTSMVIFYGYVWIHMDYIYIIIYIYIYTYMCVCVNYKAINMDKIDNLSGIYGESWRMLCLLC